MKKDKNKKIILIGIAILFLAIFIYAIIQIYGIFYSEVSGNPEINNATWKILVNGTEISTGIVQNFTITEINIDTVEGVKPGKLAPGTSGDFTINIDPSDTDVSIKYTISLDDTKLTNNNIKIQSVEETNANNTLIKTGINEYTGIITLQEIQQGIQNTVKVGLIWEDSGDEDVTNSQYGGTVNGELDLPVTVTVTQYLGEEITEYTETNG